MGLWQAHDASRTSAQAPTSARENTARTRPRTHEARESGEEAGARDQEERKEWTDGGGQGASKGSRANEEIYPEILPDANTAAGHIATNTNCPKQRADDAKHERCHAIAR